MSRAYLQAVCHQATQVPRNKECRGQVKDICMEKTGYSNNASEEAMREANSSMVDHGVW